MEIQIKVTLHYICKIQYIYLACQMFPRSILISNGIEILCDT